jgi:hypothetical protein
VCTALTVTCPASDCLLLLLCMGQSETQQLRLQLGNVCPVCPV